VRRRLRMLQTRILGWIAFRMIIARSILLFVVAAIAEIGGAWLIWQGVREHRGLLWIGGGVVALGLYGFVATLQPDANFGRILAAYGGIFVAGASRRTPCPCRAKG
jgi:small multidrug resistance family-3 protein